MWAAARGDACQLRLNRLWTGATLARTNLLWKDNSGDCRTDKPDASYYRRRLVYGCVNFVIGSLGKVGLRDCGDAYDGARQEQNERPDSSSQRSPPRM
jgi:hypothetical protein